MSEQLSEEQFNEALISGQSQPSGVGLATSDEPIPLGLSEEEIARFEAEDNSLDFETVRKTNKPTIGNATKNNQAALGATLSGESDIAEKFTQLRDNLDDETFPTSMENIEAVLASEDDEARKGVVERFISDPTKTPEQRTEFLQGYLMQRERQNSLLSQYMSKLAAEDSEGESLEADDNRINAAELITQASESKRAEQRVYNSYFADSNVDTIPFVIDFAEAVLPFSVQAGVEKTKTAFEREFLEKDTAGVANFLGSIFNPAREKSELISMIDRIPSGERVKMAEALSQIVTRTAGITGLNRNDFEKQIILRELTEGGYYGDTEKFLDTIIAGLDLVGLSGAARALRGPARAPSGFTGPVFDDVFASSPFDKAFKEAPTSPQGEYVKYPTTTGETLQARTSPSMTSKEAVVGKPQPSSPLAAAKDTNPGEARKLYAAGVEDETGKVAEAVSGVDKGTHAYAYPMPNPKMVDDVVDEIPADLFRQGRISDDTTKELVRFSYQPSGVNYSKFEQDAASSRIYNDLAEAVGLSPRLGMSKYDNSRGFTNTTMVYGATPDTGFRTIREALDTVEFNLRSYGVTKDDLNILVQDPITRKYLPSPASSKSVSIFGNTAKPIKETEYDTAGNFLVELNHKRSFNQSDTDIFGSGAITNKFLDRGFGHLFTADRYIADAATRFTDYIARGASHSVDKGFAIQKRLMDLLENRLGNLDAESQFKVLEIAKESNNIRHKFSSNEAILKGLSRKEADGLHDWYRFWDTVWELDNRDLIRTLERDGFMLFKNDTSGTEMFVKPVSKGEARSAQYVYDPHTDQILDNVSEEMLRDIYQSGGTLARSKRPITVHSASSPTEGVVQTPVSYVVARQDTSNVLRGLREDDVALNYIPGYYRVDYGKNKYYIDKITKDSKGVETITTVAASDRSGKANFAAERLTKNTPDGVEYKARPARETKMITDDSDAEWDLNTANGRSPQRFRGERLSSIDGGGDLVEGTTLLRDPVETAHQTASSLSKRVAMRDWIEAMHQRFVNDYGEFTNGIFPDAGSAIKGHGFSTDNARLADAKALHEYIRFMEQVDNGVVDNAFKTMNIGIAELIEGASKSVGRGVIAAPFRKASEISPTQKLRSTSFQAYIAMNPARQFVVQSWQWSQLLALDPKFVGEKLPRQMSGILGAKGVGSTDAMARVFGVSSKKELDDIIQMWEDSGLHQAVDANVLIEASQRQTLTDRAATKLGRSAQATARVPGAALNLSKQVGFDAGEYVNLLSAWLYARNKAIKEGLDLTNPEVGVKIQVDARLYSYSMNKAGQFAHSDGLLGVLTQYMTVPQKAILSMVPGGSNIYTPMQRRQLATFNLVAYGPPANLFTALTAMYFESTGEVGIDPEVAQRIERGLMDLAINEAIKQYTGRESTLDIEGSFAPGAITPWYDLIQGLLEEPMTAFASGSLLFGDKSRLFQIYNKTRFAWERDDLDTPEKIFESIELISGFASGMSNFWKAGIMREYGHRYAGSARELPGAAGTPEQIAALLGIQDRTIGAKFETFKKIKEKKEAITRDVELYYAAAKDSVLRRGVDKDAELFLEAQRIFWTAYEADPEAKRFAREEFARISAEDAKTNTDASLVNALVKSTNVMGREEYINLVNSAALKEDTKRVLIEAISPRYDNAYRPNTPYYELPTRLEPTTVRIDLNKKER